MGFYPKLLFLWPDVTFVSKWDDNRCQIAGFFTQNGVFCMKNGGSFD